MEEKAKKRDQKAGENGKKDGSQRRLSGNRRRAVFIAGGLGSTGSSKTGGRGNL